uniref:CSON009888 protein n=1 Tax=Culicoides sonorensis TaxID=179676 RepID=A0A336MD90_CULSO
MNRICRKFEKKITKRKKNFIECEKNIPISIEMTSYVEFKTNKKKIFKFSIIKFIPRTTKVEKIIEVPPNNW